MGQGQGHQASQLLRTMLDRDDLQHSIVEQINELLAANRIQMVASFDPPAHVAPAQHAPAGPGHESRTSSGSGAVTKLLAIIGPLFVLLIGCMAVLDSNTSGCFIDGFGQMVC